MAMSVRAQAIWLRTFGPEANGSAWDRCGRWIFLSAYGDRQSVVGWEIDHVVPKSKGGTDAISNLEPVHWETNARKGSTAPQCDALGAETASEALERIRSGSADLDSGTNVR